MVDAEGASVENGAMNGEDATFDQSIGEHPVGDKAFGREIGQQGTEGDRHEEEGLEFPADPEIKQDTANTPHNDHLPRYRGNRGQLEERGKVVENVEQHESADLARRVNATSAFGAPREV